MRIVHTCLRYPPATGGAETYIREIVERTRSIPALSPASVSEADSPGVGAGSEPRFDTPEEQAAASTSGVSQIRDVRVLTSTMRTHHPISTLDPELLLDDPMCVQRLHHMATPIFAYPRLQALKYYIGHHQPDILHSYGFWYQPADVTARYAKKHNIPFIFHPIYYENENRQKAVWQMYKSAIGQKTFAAADVVVVISPFEQKLIEEAFRPAPYRGAASGTGVKRFELVPPGIDTAKFDRPRLNPFLKKGLSENILLAVNRLSPGKGLDELIPAFASVLKQAPTTHLVLIGEDFGEQPKLQSQVTELGIGPCVHFWGKVDDETLVAAYQHADIFVHPSHYEAFGIVVAEALAAGTPVVARNRSAIPFVAPHNKVGLLFNSSEELTSHILALLKNSSLRQKFSQAGPKHIRENFTWEKSISKILELYDEFRK